ncbi:hypothetical protein MMC18_006984 [Xylographa bjoerkii]|nr:hypothetical protein [Xylographa bjoerkii]
MANDLSTTVPRKATHDIHPSPATNPTPPHLRVLEEEPPLRAPAPAKPKRQVWKYPHLTEQFAMQETAEKETIAQNGLGKPLPLPPSHNLTRSPECPICQEGFHDDEAVLRIEGCRHTFHTTDCFKPVRNPRPSPKCPLARRLTRQQWFDLGSANCPYCRGALDKLTPGTWKRGEGVIPGDFYFKLLPTGDYSRFWNGGHPELWELSPLYHAASGEWHATVRHRYEAVWDLSWDEPLGTYEERFGSEGLVVPADDGLQRLEPEQPESEAPEPLVLRSEPRVRGVERAELQETIRVVRRQLNALGEMLRELEPEQALEAEPIYRLLRWNLLGYLRRLAQR